MVATKITKVLACLLAVFSPLVSAHGQNVLTQHNDNGRTGQNLNETILTPTNVNPTTFGKLFSMPVDGYVYAQPLYMSNVNIAGGTHNVVYVATEGDSVYAFDADTGAQLWHVSVIDTAHGATSGETTLNFQTAHDTNCTDLVPQVGITSTPVIDPVSGTIYVEAVSTETNATYVHRLHMLDIATGVEKSPGPKIITATVPGTSDGGSTVTFNALLELNRPGLLLSNGAVYLGYASHCDDKPYHGWLFAYNASTLAQNAVFISTPNGLGLGGIWTSGAGIAADSSGNIFTATGNGNYDATDVGDSIVKLNGSTLTLTDYFTPFNQADLLAKDFDLGSGGVLLLLDQPGSNPHELILAGKGGQELDQTTSLGGIIYVVNRDQLTVNNSHYCSSNCNNTDPEIVQEIQKVGSIAWMFGMPAYWNNTVYFWGSNDVLRAYSLTSGLLGASPSSSSTVSFVSGATPSVSASGDSNAIVWALDTHAFGKPPNPPGPAVLHAFQATNVANQLYSSDQSGSRDTAGNAVKFAVPTIANGKVYVGGQNQVTVYGLLGSAPQQVATPGITPGSGTQSSPVMVTLTDAMPGATITYTTDGTPPVPGSNGTAISSGGSFSLSFTSTATVEAIASASGFTNSTITTANYTLQQAATPSITPSSGTQSSPVTVTLTDATPGATITYTTDGTAPVPGSHGTAISSGGSFSLSFTSAATVKAIASASGFTNSAITTANYTTQSSGGPNYGSGFTSAGLTLNNGAAISGTRLRVTDGGTGEARSAFFSMPVNVASFTNTFTFQDTSAKADGLCFVIEASGPTAVGGGGGSLGYAGTTGA
ncbi:MAG TPA: chitobiase/beta-hexosaminidase C-terminal domain-containing protein, partial [Candidatus Acidoferrales bacterium]|nr:chitobiase/beta-hexosaminidase C-terminal domain-containing protein [Candidatus Acidoferrales bacterium]